MAIMILWLIILLFLGILLTALAVGAWLIYQHASPTSPIAPESATQKISSPDGNLQATIHNRPDGTYKVEVRRRGQVDSPDTGVTETWTLVYGPAIIGTLEETVKIANQQMGAQQEAQP
jgi:hypothetical protein